MWLPLAPPSLPTPATLYQPTPPLLHRRPLSGAHRIFHPDQIIPTNKTRHVRARRTTVCVRLSAARERRRETVEERRRRGRKRARGRSIAAKKVREGEGKRKKKEEKKKAEREGEVEEKERESEKGGERGERNAIDR